MNDDDKGNQGATRNHVSWFSWSKKEEGNTVVLGGLINLNPYKKDAKEYLLSDAATQEKTDIWNTFLKNVKKKGIENFSGWKIVEYDKIKLNKMKEKILLYQNDQEKLQKLIDKIQAGIDPLLEDDATDKTTDTTVVPITKLETKVEYADKTNREKVLTSLNKVIEEDKKKPIEYRWWWRTDPDKWLDCSGLLYYTIKKAGLNESLFDSRSMFKKLDTKLVEVDADKKIKKDALKDIQKWDFIFWNSINTKYKRSTWAIPEITKDTKTYRIHHIAFVDKINYDDGTIDVVESNGAQWVTKSTININDWLTTNKSYQSELYVGHVNYDDFTPAAA